MCGFSCKKKERKVLNSSLYSLTHRNARILKLVSLRVRRIMVGFFIKLYFAIFFLALSADCSCAFFLSMKWKAIRNAEPTRTDPTAYKVR